MSDNTDEGRALVTGQLQVGLSAVIGLTGIAGMCAPLILRYLKGGTLEIVGSGGTQVGTGFTGLVPALSVASGFQIQASDPPLALNISGTVYFIASGATCIVGYI